MVSGLPAFAALAVLVVLTAVSLRFYLPLAGRVFVRGDGRVGDGWVNSVDALVVERDRARI